MSAAGTVGIDAGVSAGRVAALMVALASVAVPMTPVTRASVQILGDRGNNDLGSFWGSFLND